MKKIRVHELASELNLKSKELLEIFEANHIPIKNQLSSIDAEIAEKIRKIVLSPQEEKKGVKEPSLKKRPAPPKLKSAAPAKVHKKAEREEEPRPQEPVKEKKETKPVPAHPAPVAVVEKEKPPVKLQEASPVAKVSPPKAEPVPPKAAEPRPAPVPVKEAKPAEKVRAPEPPVAVPKEKPREVQPAAKIVEKVEPAPPPEPPVEVIKPVPVISLTEAITVKDFAEKLGVTVNELIKRLILKGIMATVNQMIDPEVATSLGQEMGVKVEVVSKEEEVQVAEEKEDESLLHPRSPVVTIMGHVDHGKTSLLDAIRQTRLVDKEAGGITQHIGAYDVQLDHGKVVFLDTPGHEAFTEMRARGSKVTDIVILVVAADDGVMPQTVEAIHHAEAAGVPIMVAVNKIDKPNAQPERIRQELTKYGLIPEEWGGKTIYADVSAKQKLGIDHLLEMVLLQAEILELKANPSRLAKGSVIEAKLDKGRGPVATILVQKGTLKVGDPCVCGNHSGKVRAMFNHKGKKLKDAGPSTPVEVLGLSGVPSAGDSFVVVESDRQMRQIIGNRQSQEREEGLYAKSRIRLEDLHDQIEAGKVKELNLVLKTDVQGSIEALNDSLSKASTEKTRVRIIHAAVGGITETDVMLAAASNAVVVGFNVRPSDQSAQLANREKVEVKLYTIIYSLVNDIKAALTGMLEPEYQEKILGKAEVRQTFSVPKIGVIAGCRVLDGKINRNSDCRLIRDSVVIYQGKISSLRRFKDDVKEVLTGFECGIGFDKFQDLKIGDIVEPFTMEEIKR